MSLYGYLCCSWGLDVTERTNFIYMAAVRNSITSCSPLRWGSSSSSRIYVLYCHTEGTWVDRDYTFDFWTSNIYAGDSPLILTNNFPCKRQHKKKEVLDSWGTRRPFGIWQQYVYANTTVDVMAHSP